MKIQLTQQIIVSNKSNKFAQLDELCFLSKNLYNVALYHIRQYYKETGKYLSYNKLAKTLSDSNNLDYIVCLSKAPNHTFILFQV